MWLDQVKRKAVKEEKELKDGSQRIKQVTIRQYSTIPMRKAAVERLAKWTKYGEVANNPRGQHRQGDYQKDSKPTFLDADEGVGEDQLVDQVKNLSSEQIKLNRLREESKKEEGIGSGFAGVPEKKKKTAGDINFSHVERFSVKVSNIIHIAADENFTEFVGRLKKFLEEVMPPDYKNKVKKWGFKRDRKNAAKHAPFMFLEFDDKEVAQEVERVLNGEAYFGQVQLSATMSSMKGLRN
jgi:hypothetical protein